MDRTLDLKVAKALEWKCYRFHGVGPVVPIDPGNMKWLDRLCKSDPAKMPVEVPWPDELDEWSAHHCEHWSRNLNKAWELGPDWLWSATEFYFYHSDGSCELGVNVTAKYRGVESFEVVLVSEANGSVLEATARARCLVFVKMTEVLDGLS